MKHLTLTALAACVLAAACSDSPTQSIAPQTGDYGQALPAGHGRMTFQIDADGYRGCDSALIVIKSMRHIDSTRNAIRETLRDTLYRGQALSVLLSLDSVYSISHVPMCPPGIGFNSEGPAIASDTLVVL